MIDNGAGKYSTAGYQQHIAIKREIEDINLNTSTKISVAFGKGSTCDLLGLIDVKTPIGRVDYHAFDSNTPFLLSIADTKRLNVYLNNVDDKIYAKLIPGKPKSGNNRKLYEQLCSVVMKFGHPFLRKILIIIIQKTSSFGQKRHHVPRTLFHRFNCCYHLNRPILSRSPIFFRCASAWRVGELERWISRLESFSRHHHQRIAEQPQ